MPVCWTMSSIDASRAALGHFEIRSASSLRIALISIPTGDLWLTFNVHVVDADTLMFLSIDNTDRLEIYFNNLGDNIVRFQWRLKKCITRTRGHPFIQWKSHISCSFTAVGLRQLHRRFCHPSIDKLVKILERSGAAGTGLDTRRVLQSIEESCDAGQTCTQELRRFNFTLRDDKKFNRKVYVDRVHIEGKPALHVIDKSTNFLVRQVAKRHVFRNSLASIAYVLNQRLHRPTRLHRTCCLKKLHGCGVSN